MSSHLKEPITQVKRNELLHLLWCHFQAESRAEESERTRVNCETTINKLQGGLGLTSDWSYQFIHLLISLFIRPMSLFQRQSIKPKTTMLRSTPLWNRPYMTSTSCDPQCHLLPSAAWGHHCPPLSNIPSNVVNLGAASSAPLTVPPSLLLSLLFPPPFDRSGPRKRCYKGRLIPSLRANYFHLS